MYPLVSVIMPCLNSSKTIASSIKSVQMQTYKNFELIVVDDGSVDDSHAIAKSFSHIDSRIKVFKNINFGQGVAIARNFGLRLAQGKYIAFLDSDDLYEPDSLMLRVHTAISKNAMVVYGSYRRLLDDGSYQTIRVRDSISYFNILCFNYISNTTGMYDAEVLGLTLQEPVGHEDYLMWCHLIKRSRIAFSCGDTPIGIYRVSSNSLSSNKLKSFWWHWVIVYQKLRVNLLFALFFQSLYVARSLLLRVNRRQ
jgi:teichuronic acid biosynthesis glycosyltransferase TuaG